MDDESSTASDLALVITQAVDAYVKARPDVDVMQVCAALGAAGGALVSVSIPAGNEGADHTALDLMTHGFTEFLIELRKAMAN
ncbi:hypothetical protein [Lichenibacterium ramalinae]|jgi:hypothetical protein|nr:hypothetical protein [Lichenibacterium ramalinae]